ncbi:MAG: hypothetical protein KJ770_07690 [Actinobacteria bacterium]|nr:hypothetical protein [Actinomycetota bacterium]
MIFILVAIGAFIVYFLFSMIKNSFVGKNYWVKCEKDYYNLLKIGYDKRSALMEISKQSHPELSDFVHEKIVEKFYDLDKLVLFIFNAGGKGRLDFQPATNITDSKKLTEQIALSIIKNTTINEKGMVNTNLSAVRKEIQ